MTVRKTGKELSAHMTPEARTARARNNAMKRHYGRLVPIMREWLESGAAPGTLMAYPSLEDLSPAAWAWVFRAARREMGY